MNRALKTILAVAGAFLFLQQAHATPINGSIEFSGTSSASGPSGVNPVTIHFNSNWSSLSAIADYAVVPNGTAFTFTDFTFIGDGSAATLTMPVTPLWTGSVGATTFSFDLLALTNGHVDQGSMAFSGTGIAHITGLDPTPASWALQGAGNNFQFTLSSSSIATVPEGNTTILLVLGLGLIGAVTLRRKLAA